MWFQFFRNFKLRIIRAFAVFALLFLSSLFSHGAELVEYGGDFSPRIMSLYSPLQDVWAAQLNFGLFSIVVSEDKDFTKSTILSKLHDLEEDFKKDPIKVRAKIGPLSSDLRGFFWDFNLESKAFTKVLVTRSPVLKVRVSTKVSGCDGESVPKSAELLETNTERLIGLLRETRYTVGDPFLCELEVNQVLLGDDSRIVSFSKAADLMFNNFAKTMIPNVYRFEKESLQLDSWFTFNRRAITYAKSSGSADLKLSMFEDSTISIENTTNVKVDFLVPGQTDSNVSMSEFFMFKLSSIHSNKRISAEKEHSQVAVISQLVSLIDAYRASLVASFVLEPSQRSAYVRSKLDEIRNLLKNSADQCAAEIEDLGIVEKTLALNTINRAIEELTLVELKLEVISNPGDGIGSLQIENHLNY